jgi:hypothetical protein
MALSTAADYINQRVLRHARQLRPGYTAGAELQQDVLNEWTALVDEWNLDRFMPPTIPQYTYAVTSAGFNGNNRDYQIGPGAADFNGPRPVRILKANLIVTTSTVQSRIALAVLPFSDYGDISVLEFPPTGITEALYYEADFPIGILHFWPPIAYNSIELWTNGVLVAPAALTTVVAGTFPPGYENALIYTLAERIQYLCTKEMGPPNPKLAAWALKARQRIRNNNALNPKAFTDYQDGHNYGGNYDPNLTYQGYP